MTRSWHDIRLKTCAATAALLCFVPSVQGHPVAETEGTGDQERLEQHVLPDTLEQLVTLPLSDQPIRVDSLFADSLFQKAAKALQPPFRPEPQRALWLSLVFPGAGQIYNRKYWKLPIIYGGFLGCIYALSWNNQMLRDYSQAYLDIMDNDPDTKSYEKMLPLGYNISGREAQFKEIFKNKKNYYRKYRDMSIFAFAAVYALAVIDAYVDAELSSFDISDDLSLQLTPAVIAPSHPAGCRTYLAGSGQERGFGLAFRLNF